MKRALVAAAAAVLLAPAAASAHPGIYTVTQKVAPAGCFYPDHGLPHGHDPVRRRQRRLGRRLHREQRPSAAAG